MGSAEAACQSDPCLQASRRSIATADSATCGTNRWWKDARHACGWDGRTRRYVGDRTATRPLRRSTCEVQGGEPGLWVLWKDEKPRIEGIYGKKTVAKYNVGGLFLQLLANGIIMLRKNSKGDDLEWALQEISDPNSNDDDLILFSELDGNWIGINFKL